MIVCLDANLVQADCCIMLVACSTSTHALRLHVLNVPSCIFLAVAFRSLQGVGHVVLGIEWPVCSFL